MTSPDLFNQLLKEELELVVAINAAGLVETLLYGIHLVLFCVCIYILAANKRTTQWFILASAFAMFVLSTVDVSMTLLVLTHDLGNLFNTALVSEGSEAERHIVVKIPIFVTNNFIADLILLYRCYMVWGKSRYILIGASLLVFADSVWGFLGMAGKKSVLPQEILLPIYVWSIFGINMILTAVTVGRIFWVSRMAIALTGARNLNHRGYRTAMAVLIESSLVYTTCVFAYQVYPQKSPYRVIMVTVCMRVVAIMPTLLIVQVGLGRAVRENNIMTTSISELEFQGRSTAIVLDTLVTTRGNTETSIALRYPPDDEESQVYSTRTEK